MSNIYLEVNGVKYRGFKSLNYFKSIEALSGSFSFVASSSEKRYLPFKINTECRILYGSKPLITGYVERVIVNHSEQGHEIIVSGRDKTADIIDSTIKGNVDFVSPISLKTIIERVLNLLGQPSFVFNNVTGLEDCKENELAVAEVGENAYEFIEKYCRKRGCLLTSDGDGNVVLTRAGVDRLNGVLVSQIGGKNNNVKVGSMEYDFTDRFNHYVVRSQANASTSRLLEAAGDGIASFESTEGEAFDSAVRDSRYMEIDSESVSVDETSEKRAKWESNIRRARSMVYSCAVRSILSSENSIYEPNKLIRVKDDFCDIDAMMLIRSVDYSLDTSGGTQVNLELVQRDAYTLQASRDILESKHNKVGLDLV